MRSLHFYLQVLLLYYAYAYADDVNGVVFIVICLFIIYLAYLNNVFNIGKEHYNKF